MRKMIRCPTHPGNILKEDYLLLLSATIKDMAETLGVSRKTLSKIINERGSITPDMALRLSRAFNTTPTFWLNLKMFLIIIATKSRRIKAWYTILYFKIAFLPPRIKVRHVRAGFHAETGGSFFEERHDPL